MNRPVDKLFPIKAMIRNAGACPFCGTYLSDVTFRDELSKREATISGLCQDCQDDMFGDEEQFLTEMVLQGC